MGSVFRHMQVRRRVGRTPFANDAEWLFDGNYSDNGGGRTSVCSWLISALSDLPGLK